MYSTPEKTIETKKIRLNYTQLDSGNEAVLITPINDKKDYYYDYKNFILNNAPLSDNQNNISITSCMKDKNTIFDISDISDDMKLPILFEQHHQKEEKRDEYYTYPLERKNGHMFYCSLATAEEEEKNRSKRSKINSNRLLFFSHSGQSSKLDLRQEFLEVSSSISSNTDSHCSSFSKEPKTPQTNFVPSQQQLPVSNHQSTTTTPTSIITSLNNNEIETPLIGYSNIPKRNSMSKRKRHGLFSLTTNNNDSNYTYNDFFDESIPNDLLLPML